MQYRERFASNEEMLRAAMDGRQAALWTAMPGIIASFDPEKLTATVQPSIRSKVRAPDNSVSSVDLPVIPDVPVIYPCGGGYTLTFPIAAGDECLLVFASRCIDLWWLAGDVQDASDARMHDLSDGFAIVGPRSLARPLADVSIASTQLRADDGATTIDLNGETKIITVTAPTKVVVTAPLVEVSGNVTIAGNVAVSGTMTVTGNVTTSGTLTATGNITGAGTSLHTHTHSGVRSGTGNSGPPN